MIRQRDIPDIVVSEMVFNLGGKITKKQARASIAASLNRWEGSTTNSHLTYRGRSTRVFMAPIIPEIEE